MAAPRCVSFRPPVFVLVGLFSLAALPGCRAETAEAKVERLARPVPVLEVTPVLPAPMHSLPGQVRAAQKVNLAFSIPGWLTSLRVREGDDVKKGQIIATLDAEVASSRVRAARAAHKQATDDFERAKALFERGVIASAQKEQLENLLAIRAAELRIAERALSDSTLRAPFSGRIAQRFVDPYSETLPKQKLVSLQDIQTLQVVVSAPERFRAVGLDQAKTQAEVRFAVAPGRSFPLTLEEFSSEADSRTQTYRLVFSLERPDDLEILPGMTASVALKESAEAAASPSDGAETPGFAVPASAVATAPSGQRYVWIVGDNHRVERRDVILGEPQRDALLVTSGLLPGERIATAGVSFLEPGQPVRILGASVASEPSAPAVLPRLNSAAPEQGEMGEEG